ncbi:beta-propeller fold lactonase family protein [Pseudescherichia sp.]|uniref:YncE family protein n=1 Tax=Pseudescherichia sp. TaxID=2055881 RepID=UPI0028B1628A|nr:beta-propeller fold lactonase family protein [Pseudescherichia sp.]
MSDIALPDHARGVTVSPDSKTVYVALYSTDQIGIIDVESALVTDALFVGRLPMEIVLSKEGTTLYVANQDGNSTAPLSQINSPSGEGLSSDPESYNADIQTS